jgi:DNA-binding response OmpR family regulator
MILVVDDQQLIRETIARDLETEGFDVMKATNGEEALALFERHEFELIVTDIIMPGMDGLELLAEVKRRDPSMGVIIVSGYGNMTTAIDALRLGADDYLIKPFDPTEFLLRAKRCIEKHKALRKLRLYEHILPVCMYCKAVRDDTGVEPGHGRWVRMEEYLHRKGGTDVSHSCCPECFEKHKDD